MAILPLLVPGSGEPAVVGESLGLWLCEDDFVATDRCDIRSLGALGFPRDWPAVYGGNKALKALVGKRGLCAARRLAVLGAPGPEESDKVGGLSLQPLQSFANAELVEREVGMPVVRGWLVLERLDCPQGIAFVAERFWWNTLPCGKWVDFTPRPPSWSQLLLAEASEGCPKARTRLGRAEAELASRLLMGMFGGGSGDGAAGPAGDPTARSPAAPEDALAALRRELARAGEEADAACAEMRGLESQAAELRGQLHGQPPGVTAAGWSQPDSTDGSLRVGSLVRLRGPGMEGEAADLNGQEATLTLWDEKCGRWKVRLFTGELKAVPSAHLEVLDGAKEDPELSTFGCEVVGTLPHDKGRVPYHLWPLVYSGIVRVRVPDSLLARLNVQFDALHANHASPSHALFLQGEVKEGKQLTVRQPDEEYTSLLLACAEKLAAAVLREDASEFRYALDQVWTVHQRAGDYNPVHFHNNVRSHFGFSSFLHLQLPPQLGPAQRLLPATGSGGRHDGATSFIWKADSGLVRDRLECSGVLECEVAEGYLYVFPQWLQHLVWPFKGPGERRTVAANVALLRRAAEAGRTVARGHGDACGACNV